MGSTGVTAVALPTFEPLGQLKGLAVKVASGQAFWSVVSLEGSCSGSCVKTERMFAWWAP